MTWAQYHHILLTRNDKGRLMQVVVVPGLWICGVCILAESRRMKSERRDWNLAYVGCVRVSNCGERGTEREGSGEGIVRYVRAGWR